MSGLSSFGIPVPDTHNLAAAAVALLILVLVAGAAWIAGRRIGPRLTAYFEQRLGARAEGLTRRLCAILRYLVIWLGLSVALRVEPWPALAGALLGLGAAAAAALLVIQIARSLDLSRWIAWLLAIFLFVAILADAVGGLGPITATLDRLAFTIGSRRLSLLLLFQIGAALLALYVVVRFTIRIIGRLIGSARGLDPTQRLLGQKLAAIAIVTLAFFIGIDLAGIDLTALAIFSGAFGLAVGFGFQKTFGNLIAGIILLMDRSIKPGDVIEVGDSFGTVNKIGVRAVSIVTREGKEHLIPNELLMTQEVVNWSYSSRDVRISVKVGVAYECDVKLAQKLMVEAATGVPRVLENPKPVVWMTGFGESTIDHEVRVWIADPEGGVGSIKSQILNRIWELFEENGIRIPYPQREIRIREWPGPPA
jgi:small-conductance mechanosensitive channel